MTESDENVELFIASIFVRARHRTCLDWLKRRLWSVSERGVFGWCGNCCDDLESWSRGIAARRYRRRKHRDGTR